ncbi:MAG: potassium-transporting ATPase KdpC subunit [Mycobacteriales bacterium]|jgi:K+-transporting ATPase ATPase C chain
MPTRLPGWLRQHLAAARALLTFTVLCGLIYPLVILAVAQLPGLHHRAEGSLVTGTNGRVVGSALIGQSFTDADGKPLAQYFQSRPSAAGAGYDPTATSASNLGPESTVDTLDDPSTKDVDESKLSLLSQVCARSKAVGELEGVDGGRPYCAVSGVGAALAVFHTGPGYAGPARRVVSVNEECGVIDTPFVATYQGVPVTCHTYGDDVSEAELVLVRGDAPDHPAVPADAVTASGSGLDPAISPAYARLQVARIARVRNLPADRVEQLIRDHTTGRTLGFLGEPAVNVLALNLDLDRVAPVRG